MVGFHKVKTFWFDYTSDEIVLPEGWKPFAVNTALYGSRIGIVCRKWQRTEDE